MGSQEQHIWDLWIPGAGATGLSFARARINPTDTILVHAAPEKLNVEVRTREGMLIARGENLTRTTDTPMARLCRKGGMIEREDIWPTEADCGTLVIVAGGEAGVLQKWWNDARQQAWRWNLELYNHR